MSRDGLGFIWTKVSAQMDHPGSILDHFMIFHFLAAQPGPGTGLSLDQGRAQPGPGMGFVWGPFGSHLGNHFQGSI